MKIVQRFNAGNNSFLPQDSVDLDEDGNLVELLPLDLLGDSRINDDFVDVGAREYATTGKIFVKWRCHWKE